MLPCPGRLPFAALVLLAACGSDHFDDRFAVAYCDGVRECSGASMVPPASCYRAPEGFGSDCKIRSTDAIECLDGLRNPTCNVDGTPVIPAACADVRGDCSMTPLEFDARFGPLFCEVSNTCLLASGLSLSPIDCGAGSVSPEVPVCDFDEMAAVQCLQEMQAGTCDGGIAAVPDACSMVYTNCR